MSSTTEQLASMAQELQKMMAQFKITEGATNSDVPRVHHVESRHDENGNGKGKGAETPHLSLVKTS
jgi:hypothetical protein